MTRFRLERNGTIDLEFDGELLADVSSRLEDARRWLEVRIYKTASGKYVTELVGETTVPGEGTRRTVRVIDKPEDLHEGLTRDPGDGRQPFITKTALDALDDAARKDPSIITTEMI
jgi:hypothetical protein